MNNNIDFQTLDTIDRRLANIERSTKTMSRSSMLRYPILAIGFGIVIGVPIATIVVFTIAMLVIKYSGYSYP